MNDDLLKNTLPHNLETEESVLSSLFMDNKGFDEIYINPSDFYKLAHQKIFRAMLVMRSKKEPVDLVTLGHYLQDSKELDDIGGSEYLIKISDTAPIALNIKKYSQDIKDLSVKREIIIQASRILDKAMSQKGTCDDVLSYAQKAMLDIQNTTAEDNIRPVNDFIFDHYVEIEKYQTQDMPQGFSFGLPYMDKILRITGSELIIIAARPSVGKTSFALSAAKHIAQNYNTKVGFLSLEMDKEPLLDRLLSIDADINHMNFYKKGKLTPDDFSKMSVSTNIISRLPLYIDDSGRKIIDIERICRKMKRDGFGIIFIDQLSKIPGDGKQYERYTNNCNRISNLKKELRMPIVLLSQLKRDSTSEPTLSDLKQTGALEEDADIVLFIDREYKRDTRVSPDKVKIVCAKNRQGAEGFDEGLYFRANRGMFNLGGMA